MMTTYLACKALHVFIDVSGSFIQPELNKRKDKVTEAGTDEEKREIY